MDNLYYFNFCNCAFFLWSGNELFVYRYDRDNRKIARLLKNAKLRHANASLENFDFNPTRKISESLIATLSDCTWIELRQNLIITGLTGTGKTYAACTYGNLACRSGYAVYYTTATQLFEDIAKAIIECGIPRLRRYLVKNQLLIIDDFGIGGVDTAVGPILLSIIDQQSVNGSLLITSQYPTSKWHEFFNDPTIADAALDRVVHQSQIIKLQGESLRKTRAKK